MDVLTKGWDKKNRIRLPEGKINIDVNTSWGASTMGSLIRMKKNCNTVADANNLMLIHDSVNIVDSNVAKEVVGKREVYVLTKQGSQPKKTYANDIATALIGQGWDCDVEYEDIMG